jgi:PAS domain-containing protein
VAQLQAIYDFAPVGLCFMDRQFRYLSVNERLSRMSGLPVAVHLGRTVEDLYPHWFKRYEPYLRRALLGEAIGGVQVELPSARPGDTESIALASLQPALDELGEVVGILIAVTEPHGEHLQLGFDWMRPIENEWRTECSTGSQLRVAN